MIVTTGARDRPALAHERAAHADDADVPPIGGLTDPHQTASELDRRLAQQITDATARAG